MREQDGQEADGVVNAPTDSTPDATETVALLCRMVMLYDPHTAAHHERVADLSEAIAVGLGLEFGRVQSIRNAALIHDIGKISVPSQVLVRPAPLTALEWQYLHAHPQTGYDLVRPIESLRHVALTVLQHHERLDGSGYPQSLSGDQITLDARVVAVADVIEAMASHRPYRNALGIDAALDEITANTGKLFDTDVVSVCIELFKSGEFEFSNRPVAPRSPSFSATGRALPP